MANVVVVGGGIVGLCSALYCREAGFDVVVLERGRADDRPCSWGNAGMIVPSHIEPLAAPGMVGLGLRMLSDRSGPFGFRLPPTLETLSWAARFALSANRANVERAAPFLSRLNLLSRDLYSDLDSRVGGFRYAQTGLLELFRTHEGLNHGRRLVELAKTVGQCPSVLDRDAVHAMEPEAVPDVIGGVLHPCDAHIEPGSVLESLREHLVGLGVGLEFVEQVVGFELDGDKVEAAITETGRHEAEHVVLAAGSWTGEVAKALGTRVPLASGKGYSFVVPDPPVHLRVPSILVEARVAVSPLNGGTRFAGTMEIGGVLGEDDQRRVDRIRSSIKGYYPAYKETDLSRHPVWSGLRPCSPDGVPIIGPAPRLKNVVLATGHAMMGMSLGPATGLLVSQLLQGKGTEVDLRPASPARFS